MQPGYTESVRGGSYGYQVSDPYEIKN